MNTSIRDPFTGEILSEGLIYSLDSTRVLSLLKRLHKKLFVSAELRTKSTTADKTGIDILIRINDLDYITLTNVKYVSGVHPAPSISDILKIMNNFGWFPSFVRTGTNKNVTGKYYPYSNTAIRNSIVNDDVSYVMMTFEAKYDTVAEITTNYLFHVTDKRFVDKILKNGLVPKTKSKLSTHPDRVYAIDNIKSISAIVRHPGQTIKDPVYLKITVNKLNNVTWYKDPNSEGVYTYSNIPPNAISVWPDENYTF